MIIDYHDTLDDTLDSPDDNVYEKSFSVSPRIPVSLSLHASPQYVISGDDDLLDFMVSMHDHNSGKPLDNKQLVIHFDGDEIPLTTSPSGSIYFSKVVTSVESLTAEVYFDGDDEHLPSYLSLPIHVLPNEFTSGIIFKIIGENQQHSFKDHLFEFVIFQDS